MNLALGIKQNTKIQMYAQNKMTDNLTNNNKKKTICIYIYN